MLVMLVITLAIVLLLKIAPELKISAPQKFKNFLKYKFMKSSNTKKQTFILFTTFLVLTFLVGILWGIKGVRAIDKTFEIGGSTNTPIGKVVLERIKSVGGVGIGSPGNTVPLRGLASPQGDESDWAATKGYVDSVAMGTGSVGLWKSNGNNIYNSNSGYVGIGSTGPATKLDVAGNIQANTFYDRDNTAYYLDPNNSGVAFKGAGSLYLEGTGNNYFAGNVGIGTTNPRTRLELGNDGAILAIGTIGSGWTVPNLGAGTRLIWYPKKAAFRAGYADDQQWNDGYIGTASVGLGYNASARGVNSVAMGYGTFAIGGNSTALGTSTKASGSGSTAMGGLTEASGSNSTAMGYSTLASGMHSTAMGYFTEASGDYSTALGGRYLMGKTIAIGTSSIAAGTSVTAGPAANTIVLGQGASDANRLTNNIASSLMVGFNSNIPTLFVGPSSGVGTTGNVGIGTTNPQDKLHVQGDYVRFDITGKGAGKVLTSDASGRAYWDDISGAGGGVTGTGTSNKIPKWGADGKSIIDTVSPIYETAGGLVGIGTTNSSAKLSVECSTNGNYCGAYVKNVAGTVSNTASRFNIGSLLTDGSLGLMIQYNHDTDYADILNRKPSTGKLMLETTGGGILIDNAGSVGIGSAGPATKLDVAGSIQANTFYDRENTAYYLDPHNSGVAFKGAGSLYLEGTGNNYIAGNVGIGTTVPGAKLELYSANSNVVNLKFLKGVQHGMAMGIPAGSNIFTISGAYDLTSENWFNIDSAGKVGIGTTNPQKLLHVNGETRIDSTLTIANSANISMTGNIGNVAKLTVTTIDPLYEINGKKYATYVASIAGGVKEEYSGKAKLSLNSKFQIPNSKYEYVIDFDKMEKDSDLWLWRKVIDFSKDNVEVLITPYGESADIYYLIEGNKIIIRGDKPVEFSYRLTGKRFDWTNWPTIPKDQNEKASFIIK